MKKTFIHYFSGFVCCLMMVASPVKAEPTNSEETLKVSFRVSAETVVPQDKVQLIISTQLTGEHLSAKSSQEIEERVEKAVTKIKQYKNIKLSNNQRQSYANYDQKGKMASWTLKANLVLESSSFSEIAQFVSDLPKDFLVQSTKFFVSTELQKQQRDKLLQSLLTQVQQQAELIKSGLHYNQYRIINMNIDQNNVDYMMRAAPLRMAKVAEIQEDGNAVSFTPGESQLSIEANVVIALSEK
ncbi:SIMPL domain-containing protein [Gallibacterium genomosp. 1]|uniref:SIMPL domain-containing protein n=1 Tax=Gallibacterium genomosp. 1 TaxID=155515 RepID=UPI0008027B4F|nr:SIMPL domain-containing protein [Gallibacterium genomosp. 1]